MTRLVPNTIAAICYEIARQHVSTGHAQGELERFIGAQLRRMPGFLAAAIYAATVAFSLTSILHDARVFHKLQGVRRTLHVLRWRDSALAPCRDLIRFYESLAVLSLYAEIPEPEW
jgi:hypothetical protein